MTSSLGHLLIVAATTAAVGCAGLPSRGSLPDTVDFDIPKKKLNITIRHYRKSQFFGIDDKPVDSYGIESNFKLSDKIREVVFDTGVFASVDVAKFDSEKIFVSKKNKGLNERILLDAVKNSKSDYFVDFVHDVEDRIPGFSFKLLLYIPVWLSLGILPIWEPNDVNLRAILYDRSGRIIEEVSVSDEVNVWRWTPLLFAPGAKAFARDVVHVEPVILRAVRIATQKLQKSGAMK